MRGNAERRLPCTRYITTNLNDLIVVASLLLVLPLVKRVPIECIVVRVREAVRTLLSHALLRAEGEYIRAPPPITIVRTAAVNDKLVVDRYVASDRGSALTSASSFSVLGLTGMALLSPRLRG